MERESGKSEDYAQSTSLYLGLIHATLKDVAYTCNYTEVELDRDWVEIQNRVKHEGLCFLTKTLPSFAKAVDMALATDTKLNVTGFKLVRYTVLPRFLWALTSEVFNSDGWERSDASPQALRAIRQVGYLFYKLQLPLDEEQADEVINKFKIVDQSLEFNPQTLSYRSSRTLRYAKTLIARVLAGVSPKDANKFAPKHGPGAVATGEKSWEKPIFKRWYRRLAAYFPYEDYFFYNSTHLCDDLQAYLSLEEREAGTAKVVLVPKDSRGPRLISCEPLEYQWIQQGLMRVLVETIESHPLTKGYVNFTDQSVNRNLALQASKDGLHATLDMQDASDRVSLELVKALFPTEWFDALNACRSTSTLLPNGEVVTLKKFAPMGSAVCFPVEALVFWALSVASLAYDIDSWNSNGRPTVIDRVNGGELDGLPLYAVMHISESMAGRLRKEAQRSVYVYGDDIICRIEDQDTIRRQLPMFGLKFNEGKCCVGGSFRESCGCDAYKGVDVTPLRVKATWCPRLAGTAYVSWVALHNAFSGVGYFNVCDFLADKIQRVRKTPYSDLVEPRAIALIDFRKMAIHENRILKIPRRYNRELQRYEYKTWVVRGRTKNAAVPGWNEMQRIASAPGRIGVIPDSAKWYPSPFQGEGCSGSCHADRGAIWAKYPSITDPYMVVKAYQYTYARQVILRRDRKSVV